MGSKTTTEITTMPRAAGFYPRALLKTNRLREESMLPALTVVHPRFVLPDEVLRGYREACELASTEGIPLLFPHAYMGPLHLQIMTHPDFPLKLLGAIHYRNHVIQYSPLRAGAAYGGSLALTDSRRRPQGVEFDLTTEIRDESGELVWTSVSSYIVRMKLNGEDPESPLSRVFSDSAGDASLLASFEIPKSAGKKYGWVTGDINPIHMSTLLAKLFGFRRDIAHGMWTLARVVDFFDHIDREAPVRYDAVFKGPMFLGSQARVMTRAAEPGAFEVFCGENDRPSVVGRIRNVGADEVLGR